MLIDAYFHQTDLVAGDAERPRLRDRLAMGLRRAASFLAQESRPEAEAQRTTDPSRAEEALYESEHRVSRRIKPKRKGVVLSTEAQFCVIIRI